MPSPTLLLMTRNLRLETTQQLRQGTESNLKAMHVLCYQFEKYSATHAYSGNVYRQPASSKHPKQAPHLHIIRFDTVRTHLCMVSSCSLILRTYKQVPSVMSPAKSTAPVAVLKVRPRLLRVSDIAIWVLLKPSTVSR